jgi:hypothetical protein
MPRTTLPSGIEIEYDTHGSPSDPALLLVNGFTSQMISWYPDLLQQLVDQGLHVIRTTTATVGCRRNWTGRAPTRWRC